MNLHINGPASFGELALGKELTVLSGKCLCKSVLIGEFQ